MENTRLARAIKYYRSKQDEFIEKHEGKYIAIKDEKVLGVFADYSEAAKAIYPEHEYGTVLMQPVEKKDTVKVITAPTAVVE